MATTREELGRLNEGASFKEEIELRHAYLYTDLRNMVHNNVQRRKNQWHYAKDAWS